MCDVDAIESREVRGVVQQTRPELPHLKAKVQTPLMDANLSHARTS